MVLHSASALNSIRDGKRSMVRSYYHLPISLKFVLLFLLLSNNIEGLPWSMIIMKQHNQNVF